MTSSLTKIKAALERGKNALPDCMAQDGDGPCWCCQASHVEIEKYRRVIEVLLDELAKAEHVTATFGIAGGLMVSNKPTTLWLSSFNPADVLNRAAELLGEETT